MKHKLILAIGCFLLLLNACQKDAATDPAMDDNGNAPTNVTVLKTGSFTGQNGYPASGTAQTIRDDQQQHYLRLGADFKTSFATGSVAMYLSKQANLNLGDTGSHHRLGVINTNGQHDFTITANQSTDFQYVIVWCAPAGIQFGRAALQ